MRRKRGTGRDYCVRVAAAVSPNVKQMALAGLSSLHEAGASYKANLAEGID